MDDWKRLLRLLWGLTLCGTGIYLEVRANIGLSPWDAFAMGISLHTGMHFGDAVLWTGAVVLAIDVLLREKLGVGTILNAILVGKIVDLLDWMDLVPQMQSLLTGTGLLLAGLVLICIGSYYYISAGWGCGPRDSLMVYLSRRFRRLPIGLARFSVECTVLVVGWLLGAQVGLGTVLFMFGISFMLQLVFSLYRFDPKTVVHEDAAAALCRWFRREKSHPCEKNG